MFKRIRTVFGINIALARLGVDTQKLNPVWRRECQEIALKQGLSPKAAAAYMYFQMPISARPSEGLAVIDQWVSDGSISAQEADFVRNMALNPAQPGRFETYPRRDI